MSNLEPLTVADGCQSVNVIRPASAPGQPELRFIPCANPDPDHHGECGGQGFRWTRLGELLRQDGLVLAGTHVRHLVRGESHA